MKRRKYGVASQKNISSLRADSLLERNGIVLNAQNKNCLFMHNSKESTKHWMIKSIMFKLLRVQRITVGTEIEMKGGIIDLLDADNFIGYEIESAPTQKLINQKTKQFWQLHDIIFIDARKIPDDIKAAEKYLKKIVL